MGTELALLESMCWEGENGWARLQTSSGAQPVARTNEARPGLHPGASFEDFVYALFQTFLLPRTMAM